MSRSEAKKRNRRKGKRKALHSRRLSRSREFYSARSANRMVDGIRCRLRKRKGAGDTTVPDWAAGITMGSLVSSFIQLGKNTMIEKALMNIDCSTGEARWEDGALCS